MPIERAANAPLKTLSARPWPQEKDTRRPPVAGSGIVSLQVTTLPEIVPNIAALPLDPRSF